LRTGAKEAVNFRYLAETHKMIHIINAP